MPADAPKSPPNSGSLPFDPRPSMGRNGGEPTPDRKLCKYGDPFCPCQDGDPCHYEGENPMTPPARIESGSTPTPKQIETLDNIWERVTAKG